MTIGELKELIEDIDDEVEVLLAMQPNYPIEYSIEKGLEADTYFYLTEGTQLGYLPERAVQAIGWDTE